MELKITQRQKVEVEVFKLELPDVFKREPDYIVVLPAKKRAFIYNITVSSTEFQPGTSIRHNIETPGWRVLIVNKDGVDLNGMYGERGQRFTDALDVQLHLKAVAKELAKTKRTSSKVEERSDDED